MPPNINLSSGRPPFYRDVSVLKWVSQVFVLIAVLSVMLLLVREADKNLEEQSYTGGYDFLSVDPGFRILEGIDTDPATGGRALWAGMVNTIRLAIGGILLATIVGLLVGIGRLSGNWLVRRITSFYVEALRNVPLLVQILIINAVLVSLPKLTIDQGPVNGWIHLSNKGLSVPRVFIGDGFYQWSVFVLIGIAAGYSIRWKLLSIQQERGYSTYPNAGFIAVLVWSAAIGWWLHPVFGWIGSVFDFLSRGVGKMPPVAVQVAVSLVAVGLVALLIKRGADSRRTPAGTGRAKLTEDDYFRMFSVLATVFLVFFITWVAWPGLASWVTNSTRDLFEVFADKFVFEVFADKFGGGRSGQPINAMRPDISMPGKFARYGPSGLNLSRALAAIYFGVVLYTSAFIAEIVKGGILAVPKGQKEAALAIGLRRSTAMRRVILPQALRVIMPPLGNQYLNLTKNTSLAIAVGYSDVVQIGQTLYNQTGRTFEVVSLWMLFYLACSLTISVVVNFFNIRLKIVER